MHGLRLLAALYASLVMSSTIALGQTTEAQDSPGAHILPSPASIEAWADGFFDAALDSMDVPGAVFVVSDASGVRFAAGYGRSDISSGAIVSADSTLFQVASVSKLFTATAVMQLVEDGRIDLQTDVASYVPGLRVRGAIDEPVTMHQLLTHTAGFDERNVGYAARGAGDVRPLRDYLIDRMPPRSMPPGSTTSYSNHGFGLAGLVVQEVSGSSFEDYQARHVLRPLGMDRSTFRQPGTGAASDLLLDRLATGYRAGADGLEPVDFLYRNVPPAGALSATGMDMGRFMAAHLGAGAVREMVGGRAIEETRILQPSTVRTMHRQQFTNHPAMPGMAYGFMEQTRNGHRAIQHGGDLPGFGSLLFLLPERGIGFFFASNRLSNALRERLVEEFMDEFYPGEADSANTAGTSASGVGTPAARAVMLAGAWRLNRYDHLGFEKLAGVFSNEFRISAAGDTLVTQDGRRWLESRPLVFRHVGGEDVMAFRADDRGRITHMFRDIQLGGTVPGAYERVGAMQTATVHNEFYLSWVPVLMITWIVWPFGALIAWMWRRWKGRRSLRWNVGDILARVLIVAASAGMVWFVVDFVQPLARAAATGGGDWIYGMPDHAGRVLWIPYAHAALSAALVVMTVRAWRRRAWSIAGRIHFSIIVAASLAWLVFLWQVNLFV